MSVKVLGKHDEICVKGTLDMVDAIYEFHFQNILESELKEEFETPFFYFFKKKFITTLVISQ